MRRSSGLVSSYAFVALSLLGVASCSKKEEPARVAVPPPPSPPAPVPPPPSADDQLHERLAHLGAKPTEGGWTLTLSGAKFRGGKVDFAADEATVMTIVGLLQEDSHLRLQIENYLDKPGPKTREQDRSQMEANAVLRHLTAQGGDAARIQAEGRIDTSTTSRIEIIFSNAEGEFRPAPVENS